MIGRTLSHYRITERIGEGGMGVVYKAVDLRLDRSVAIKILSAPSVGQAEWKRRFIQEAKAASALNHPHIITVYEIETDGDMDFMAMEYVRGKTLHELIAAKRVPLRDALRYLTQVADALSTAHAAGIVHRDLKPANVIVGDNGQVKLLDFGLAKVNESVAASAVTAMARLTLTEPGTILGTPAYMSPEQIRGEPVDQRTDVWAFGCTLFETLSGARPFGGGSPSEILAKILETEPDWARVPQSTPTSIRQLIRHCLRKDPQRRLRHIDPLMLDVSDEFESSGASPRRSRGMLFAVLGSLILALGASLGWFISARTKTSPVAGPVLRVSTAFEAAGRPGEWNQPALTVAPDGGAIVYVGKSATGPSQLYLRRMDRLEGVALPGTEGALAPFFSPDGAAVGFFAGGRLKKVSLGDGLVQTLCDAPPYGGAWTKDNVIVFGALQGGLMRVSASGGTRDRVTTPIEGEAAHRWPALLSGGPIVVYTTSNSTGSGLEEPRLVAQSLDSGRREIVPVEATYGSFAPGGQHLLVVRSGVLMAAVFDPAQLKTTGSPVPIIEGVMQASTGAAQISASTTTLAYLQGAIETRRLVWVDRAGRIEPLDAPPRLYVHPRLSPDGRRIAVAITEPKNDIWIFDITRSALSRLTVDGSNAYPIWTPDGTKVTYVSSQQDRRPNVFWKSADGAGPEERLVTSENTQVTETWLPDGQTLLFVEFRPQTTGWDILTLPLASPRQPRDFQATRFLDGTPQISPTGRYLAYGSDESGQQEVHVRSFPGLGVRQQVSSEGGAQAAWRGDERELYFRGGGAMMVAAVTSEPQFRIGKPTILFRDQFARIQGKNYDVTRDGQRFLMIRADELHPPKEITVVLNWMDDVKSRLR